MKSGCEVCEIVIDPPSFAAPPPAPRPPLSSSSPPQAATTVSERAASRSASARLPSIPIQFPPNVGSAGGGPPGGLVPAAREHTQKVSDIDHSQGDKICP